MATTRLVAIALDNDDEMSNVVFDWAIDNIVRRDGERGGADEVCLIHVAPDTTAAALAGLGGTLQDEDDLVAMSEEAEKKQAAEEFVHVTKPFAAKLTALNIKHRELLFQGDARDAIVDACTETDASLCIVGSHNKGAIARVLVGSVSSYVVQHCPCPVLVVRPHQ